MSSTESQSITVPRQKPRNRLLNAVLMTRRGGRMKDAKSESRQQAKQQLRNQPIED